MNSQFSTLIGDTRRFLAELSTNNTTEWFHANKRRYETELKSPALALLDTLSAQIQVLSGSTVTTKLWRAHRDVRFSKDKSPYNLHLHMLWAPQGGGTQPGYFFGISTGYVSAGAGIMRFDKHQIADWRAFVSEREGAALQNKIDAVLALGGRQDAPELKRVPSPFDNAHPQSDLLRRKSFVLWKDLTGTTDLQADLVQAFTNLNPAMDDLRGFL